MLHIKDGLKPSYRRIIWTGLEHPDKLTKVATLCGVCGGKYSPHSPDSLPPVVSELVHAGIFIGQGSHGNKSIYSPLSIESAASRYIEAKLNPDFRKMISGLIKHVDYKESELNSLYKEPVYLPTPVPLSLTYGSLGMGVGIRVKAPNFSAKSMLDAYLKNDYNLLESNSDLKILKSRSDLKSIWENGTGDVAYSFFVKKHKLERNEGFLLYGDSRFIQLSSLGNKLLNPRSNKDNVDKIGGWVDKGMVVMHNLSSKKGGNKLFFYIKKSRHNGEKITNQDLKDHLESIKTHCATYKLAVTDGEQTKVRGLKEFIHECYTEFCNLVETHKKYEIDRLNLKILVVKHSKDIANLVIKNPKITLPEIAKNLSLTEEVVSETLKKSISVLLKVNETEELKTLNSKVKETKKLKPKNFYEHFIN